MTLLQEALNNQSGATFKAALDAGIDTISGGQEITFTKYNRVVLPADGFVFWVKDVIAEPIPLKGSLHHVLSKQQDPEQSFGRNQIVFTSETDAQQAFNALGSASIFIGTISDVDVGVRFAFSNLSFYANAGIYHYSGIAIMPHMQSQILDDPASVAGLTLVVSNSLPLFLQLNDYVVGNVGGPFYGFGNSIPLFPSHITTPNFTPPYGSIEITNTTSMSDRPWMDMQSTRWQAARDKVSIVLNGVDHYDAMGFVDCLYQYSRDLNYIGLTDGPHVRDEKIAQPELFMIAMRKRIDLEVNYQQTVARDIARQLMEKASTSVQPIWPSSSTWASSPN